MDCQLSAFIYTKIKVMKRGAWDSQMTVISSFVCWLCTMQVSRHFCEEPFCVSTEILLEYEEILAAVVSPYMADIVIQALINRPNLIRVEPTWRWHLIEADQDDNKFVDCAITGQAEYIVSNDSHFRVLRQIPFPYVPLMTLSEFTQDLNATHNS